MTSENNPNPVEVRDFLEVLYPLIQRIRSERTISPGKIGILHHLKGSGKATTSELAAAVHVSPQGISLGAKELEHLGFIKRIPDENDRRKIWFVLTETGTEKLAREVQAGEVWMKQAITEQLNDEERQILKAAIPVLRKIGWDSPLV